MLSKEIVERIIIDTIREITKINIDDKDAILVNANFNIFPADFLYIFDRIEKQFGVSTSEIIQNCTFEVMTVNNLAEKICLLINISK